MRRALIVATAVGLAASAGGARAGPDVAGNDDGHHAALEAAGLRVRVWGQGKENSTAERDGSIKITPYIDL